MHHLSKLAILERDCAQRMFEKMLGYDGAAKLFEKVAALKKKHDGLEEDESCEDDEDDEDDGDEDCNPDSDAFCEENEDDEEDGDDGGACLQELQASFKPVNPTLGAPKNLTNKQSSLKKD